MSQPEFSPQAQLWEVVTETAAGIVIHDSCAVYLREFIQQGVERMQQEGRIAPGDLETARTHLREFVDLMKAEAISRGHPAWLGEDTFFGAQQKVRFALWPWWPPSRV